MAKIADMSGNRSGSYRHLFDDERLGHLISQTHAASIRAGTELERILHSLIPPHTLADLRDVVKGLDDPLNVKQIVFKPSRPKAGRERGIVSDFAIFFHQDEEFYVVELKIGYDFDTQKAQVARQKLQQICEHLTHRTGYAGKTFMCSFNASSRAEIITGFKREFTEDEVMLGHELCFYLGVDYEEVLTRLRVDQTANRQYFLERVDKIQNGATPEEYFASLKPSVGLQQPMNLGDEGDG
jgi:hypothetical protein